MVLSAQTTDLAQQHIHDLQSPDVETQRRASKAIRDSVIGNWPKKRLYIGLNLVPRTLELLQNAATDEQVTIQLITALGSCTYQAEAGRSLSDANVWATLARYIHHPNLKVVEASVCALKLMLANTAAPERPTLSDADVRRIVALIGPQPAACPSSMHEHCALLLATYCAAPANQRTVAGQKDAIRHLADLVLSNVPIVQEAALKCLAALVHKQPPIAAQVLSMTEVVDALFQLIKHRRLETRLCAARTMAHLHLGIGLQDHRNDLCTSVLPMVIRLLSSDKTAIREAAPAVLSDLIGDNEELAKAASDANGVSKISAAMISDISDPMKEGCLEALAVMCAKRDESRRVVINSKVLPVICASLGHSNAAIRRAACRCTQSLSRSASHIRIALADATVLEPFLELLSDESTDVRLAAGATINNLVMDFPSMKTSLKDIGGIPLVAQFIKSQDAAVRAAGVTVLRNLICRGSLVLKTEVLQHLSLPMCLSLLDDVPPVAGQTALYLRNLFATNAAELLEAAKADLEPLIAKAQRQACAALQGPAAGDEDTAHFVANVVWLCSHLAVGDTPLALLMEPPSVHFLLQCLQTGPTEVHLAAAWCVCNLAWPAAEANPVAVAEREKRRELLRAAGVPEALQSLQVLPTWELTARVSQAIELLS